MNMKLVSALLLLPISLVAQDDPAKPTPAKRAVPEIVVVSLQFGGGTLAEFVAAVRQDQPKANVVLANAARQAVVPPMVLMNAGLEQALAGACMAAEADFDVRVQEFRGAGEPVYSIVANKRPGPTNSVAGVNPNLIQQRVFSLNDLTAERASGLQSMRVATILSAIELSFSEEKIPPSIRFHEDSGLLLVRGFYSQAEVVEQTLAILGKDLAKQDARYAERKYLEEAARLKPASEGKAGK